MVMVIAHRGASGERPEHSAGAYALAIEQGADAIEPDLVATRDGVLVIRHENELSTTTDIAARPEFAARRRVGIVDGIELDGWFTEDFDWAELATLEVRERIPELRPANTAFDGGRMLRLADAAALVRDGGAGHVGLVLELKHGAHFAALGLDLVDLLLRDLAAGVLDGLPLWVESFELGVLERLAAAGFPAPLVFLVEAEGAPADGRGIADAAARDYAGWVRDDGLEALAASGLLTGVSVDKALLLDADGAPTGLADRVRAAGLACWTWTLRSENTFLQPVARIGDDPAAWGDWRREFGTLLASVDAAFLDHPRLAR